MTPFALPRRRIALAFTLAVALAAATIAFISTPALADTAPQAGTPSTVSVDVLPTVQINGVVWSQAIIGNTVYAGGEFTSAQPAGAAAGVGTVARTNLLAYDLTTGALITTFNPVLNGNVKAVTASPDGTRLYIGGQFTKIGTVNRYRLAALDPTTGAVITAFSASPNATVSAIAATNTTVYVGGTLTAVGSTARTKVAAVNASNGALVSTFAPAVAGGNVLALTVSPDGSKVVIGGSFTTLNGSNNPGLGMGMVNATTGANLTWKVGSLVRNGGSASAITSLSTDGTSVFGTGYKYGNPGNLEGSFRATWADGTLVWLEDCHGDTYSGAPNGDAFYVAGHPHYCGNIGSFPQTTPNWTFHRGLSFSKAATGTITADYLGYFNFAGNPSPSALNWFPDINAGTYTGQSQGPWNVFANSNYVLYGGEFTTINGVRQQGLARFAIPSIAPNKEGPDVTGAGFTPSGTSITAGTVHLNWEANYDRDNELLTYDVIRNGATVFTTTGNSRVWNRPEMGFDDSGLTPGATYTYRIRATDPWGNAATGNTINVTVSGSSSVSSYVNDVLSDGAVNYWRLGESSGSVVADWAGHNDAVAQSGVSRGTAGAIHGDSNTASTFDGSTSGFAPTRSMVVGPQTFSIEAWFKTTSTAGGRIVGFSSSDAGDSPLADRMIYMDTSGRVLFGVNGSGKQTLQSGTGLNNGAWHHVVGTLSSSGMNLYVDGTKVSGRTDAKSAQKFTGYWRIGGDSSWSGAKYFNGAIDDVAIYPSALTAAQVTTHRNHGVNGGTVGANTPPTASFTSSTSTLTVNVDGSASNDPDGTIASYAWTFGDGGTATGAIASHTYAAAGTYSVTLTVTDDLGATGTKSSSVTVVTVPNVPPTASFTSSTSNLTASVNGSASNDPDGTIASYAWTFGDGGTATGVTASHAYGAEGTYTVTLTVTDNLGATGSTSSPVTVTAPVGGAPFASDAFGRTVSNGWGSADVGGVWTQSGGAANLSVSGGAGNIVIPVAGGQVGASLNSVSSTSTDLTASLTVDKVATGGGIYLYVTGRKVSTNNEYRASIRLRNNNTVGLSVVAYQGSSSGVTLGSEVILPGTITAGTAINVRLQVTGTSPTTIRAKIWLAGASEPAAWTVSATDTFASLQAAGGVGFVGYVSGSATNTPITVSVRNLSAVPAV